MFGIFKKSTENEDVILVNGEHFEQKYKDGYYLVADVTVRDTANPNLRTTFHKREAQYAKIKDVDLENLTELNFYASRNITKLKAIKHSLNK